MNPMDWLILAGAVVLAYWAWKRPGRICQGPSRYCRRSTAPPPFRPKKLNSRNVACWLRVKMPSLPDGNVVSVNSIRGRTAAPLGRKDLKADHVARATDSQLVFDAALPLQVDIAEQLRDRAALDPQQGQAATIADLTHAAAGPAEAIVIPAVLKAEHDSVEVVVACGQRFDAELKVVGVREIAEQSARRVVGVG